jgi:medium-chain acyl-[acyl-carrier-protein] hydrolase
MSESQHAPIRPNENSSVERPDPWIERWGEKPLDGPRLLCFPYAGGGANIFRAWQANLPGIEVCPVQLPGRERRMLEPPLNRMGELVSALLRGLNTWLDRPFALFGHSNGALIAFELANALARAGAPTPAHLFVSGCAAPHLLATLPEAPHVHTDEQLVAELRRLAATPEEIMRNREAIDLILPAVRADMEMFAAYVHAPAALLDIPITAFGGTQDEEVPESTVRAWASHTASRFAYEPIPGDHFFVLSHKGAIQSALREALAPLRSAAAPVRARHPA